MIAVCKRISVISGPRGVVRRRSGPFSDIYDRHRRRREGGDFRDSMYGYFSSESLRFPFLFPLRDIVVLFIETIYYLLQSRFSISMESLFFNSIAFQEQFNLLFLLIIFSLSSCFFSFQRKHLLRLTV